MGKTPRTLFHPLPTVPVQLPFACLQLVLTLNKLELKGLSTGLKGATYTPWNPMVDIRFFYRIRAVPWRSPSSHPHIEKENESQRKKMSPGWALLPPCPWPFPLSWVSFNLLTGTDLSAQPQAGFGGGLGKSDYLTSEELADSFDDRTHTSRQDATGGAFWTQELRGSVDTAYAGGVKRRGGQCVS